MTPISLHNDLPVVRHSTTEPSPFLVRATPILDTIVQHCHYDAVSPSAIDIGCGNGRQSRFLEKMGFEVLSFDRKPDYGYQIELEKQQLPILSGSVNVAVLSYVLMFLNHKAALRLVRQTLKSLRPEYSAMIVELQDVKSGCIHGAELVELLDSIEKMAEKYQLKTITRRKSHLLVAKGR